MVNLFGEETSVVGSATKYPQVTKNGYAVDEVISTVQKEIRRGNEENGVYWALELIESGMTWYLFSRLKVMALEDCNSLMLFNGVVNVANEIAKIQNKPERVKLYAVSVVIQLCRAEKDRTADDMKNWWNAKRADGVRLDIPDYGIDKHTKRGYIGKTRTQLDKEFLTEGTKLCNIGVGYNVKYRDELLERYER